MKTISVIALLASAVGIFGGACVAETDPSEVQPAAVGEAREAVTADPVTCTSTCSATGGATITKSCTTSCSATSASVTCNGVVTACAACASGLTNCSGTCVNLETSAADCGACGNVCASGDVCTSGVCTAACKPVKCCAYAGGCGCLGTEECVDGVLSGVCVGSLPKGDVCQ